MKTPKMKKFRVLAFTEEYAVNVYFGSVKDVSKAAGKYMKCSAKAVERDFEGHRGVAWNCFPESNPLIVVDASLPWHVALATLSHEASHAMDYIAKAVGMEDKSGEFHAHGIAAVMRTVLKEMKPKIK